MGTLDILNCGEGHLEITFKGDDAAELDRAKRIITDMLKRGFALFVHGPDDTLIRVKKFDPKQNEYVIADDPSPIAEVGQAIVAGRTRTRKERRVPMTSVKTTAIGRSAGG